MNTKEEHIKLRILNPDDLDWLLEVENDKRFWPVSGTEKPFARKTLKEYITHSQIDFTVAKQERFVITFKNESIGLIDLFDYDAKHNRAGVGILILKEFQSKGFAYDALNQLIDYSFFQLGLHQLYANILLGNERSLGLFKKSGFTIIGVKKDWIKINDQFKDEYILQLINKE